MALVDTSRPLLTQAARTHGRHVYVRPPKPVHFPSFDDPEQLVSETKRHLKARTTLFLLLEDAFSRTAAIGSDQFVYWDAENPRKCLGPDAFVKLGAKDDAFDNWKTWERGAPDLAVEIVSTSDRPEDDWNEKLTRYRMSGIREVLRFDAENEHPIRVWDRVEGDLVERAGDDPALRECATLDLWWTVERSELGSLLRLSRDRDGHDLLPTPDEDRMRLAEELAEERKARTTAEHQRMLVEHKLREETQARERDRLLAEQKLHEETQARERDRLLAAQKLHEEAQTHERERTVLQEQIEQLQAELLRLRAK